MQRPDVIIVETCDAEPLLMHGLALTFVKVSAIVIPAILMRALLNRFVSWYTNTYPVVYYDMNHIPHRRRRKPDEVLWRAINEDDCDTYKRLHTPQQPIPWHHIQNAVYLQHTKVATFMLDVDGPRIVASLDSDGPRIVVSLDTSHTNAVFYGNIALTQTILSGNRTLTMKLLKLIESFPQVKTAATLSEAHPITLACMLDQMELAQCMFERGWEIPHAPCIDAGPVSTEEFEERWFGGPREVESARIRDDNERCTKAHVIFWATGHLHYDTWRRRNARLANVFFVHEPKAEDGFCESDVTRSHVARDFRPLWGVLHAKFIQNRTTLVASLRKTLSRELLWIELPTVIIDLVMSYVTDVLKIA